MLVYLCFMISDWGSLIQALEFTRASEERKNGKTTELYV